VPVIGEAGQGETLRRFADFAKEEDKAPAMGDGGPDGSEKDGAGGRGSFPGDWRAVKQFESF